MTKICKNQENHGFTLEDSGFLTISGDFSGRFVFIQRPLWPTPRLDHEALGIRPNSVRFLVLQPTCPCAPEATDRKRQKSSGWTLLIVPVVEEKTTFSDVSACVFCVKKIVSPILW